MKMKILWISQNLPYPPKTGVLQRNYNLIRQAAQFADVHLVAILKQDILPNFDRELAERELRKLCPRVDVVQLPVESSRLRFMWVALKSLWTERPFTANWGDCAELREVLARALQNGSYDVVFFDSISLAVYRHMMGRAVRVLNHHNIESHLFERRITFERHALKRWYSGIEARKLRRYEAQVADQFDLNVTCSELDSTRLKEICPRAATDVVANGVDVEYFYARPVTAEPGHLVMVSGMNWFPNRDAAIYMAQEIWPLLSAAMPNLKLTIVGASPPEEVVELAKRDARVVATGFVDDVRPYIERAQVYLCPMRDGGGTRLKILDALSMGKPIVATTMAMEGIAVEAERDALLADTPADFVRQIGRAVGDAELCTRLGANARAFVEQHFSWPVIGRHMQTAFTRLIAARTVT